MPDLEHLDAGAMDALMRRLRERIALERRVSDATATLASRASHDRFDESQREPAGPRAGDSMPLASIIVLNFNGAAVVGRCLDHLLAQTYPHREIIVVDNGSTDDSLRVLEPYLSRPNVSVIRNATNRGVGGGRNLGLRSARGDVIAFMDNDGLASPTWLAEVVRTLRCDPSIGAVASLVFFNERKILLNSAGGTLNYRGHGGDWCFNVPYEFAVLPRDVLYPMGCGMAIRRQVMDTIGPLDEAVLHYSYDDVEIGIRTWACGFRVVLAPLAWVDHEYGFAERFDPQTILFRERGRIRNVLKYFPVAQLLPWLLHEVLLLDYLRSPALWTIPFSAWGWNLLHLPSALRRRRRLANATGAYWQFVYPSWRGYPWLKVQNQLHHPDPELATPRVRLDGGADSPQLNFGWYASERDRTRPYRWAARAASAIIRIGSADHVVIDWRAARPGQEAALLLRRLGDLAPVWQQSDVPPLSWEQRRYPCVLGPGLYEFQLHTTPVYADSRGREVGVAVSAIEFV